MKTIITLTATDDGKPTTAPMARPAFVRNGKTITAPFTRRIRQTAKGIYCESSLGAQVFIPHTAIEAVEPLYKSPEPSVPSPQAR